MRLTPSANPKKVSTIETSDILDIATAAVRKYTGRMDASAILLRYGSHLTIEDLVMETVERVLRANPLYLTRSYVYNAAFSACTNALHRKKLTLVDAGNIHPFAVGLEEHPITDSVVGDADSGLLTLETELLTYLGEEETVIYKSLLDRRLYSELSKDLGISPRTLERRVAELKWKLNFILNEEEV